MFSLRKVTPFSVGLITILMVLGPVSHAKRVDPPVKEKPPVTRVSVPKLLGWSSTMTERCEQLRPVVKRLSALFKMDAPLVMGIIRVESGFQNVARSRVGATGLMQVMPSTGAGLKCGTLTDPIENITCGIRVLNGFLKYYKRNIIFALSGYNAGFGMPNRARRAGTLPANIRYAEKVLAARAQFIRYGCRGR